MRCRRNPPDVWFGVGEGPAPSRSAAGRTPRGRRATPYRPQADTGRPAGRRGRPQVPSLRQYVGTARSQERTMVATPKPQIDIGEYKYGFHDEEDYFYKSKKGLSREVVVELSKMKGEPDWMRDYRLKSLEHFEKRPMPNWGSDKLAEIDFEDIYYYIRPTEKQ